MVVAEESTSNEAPSARGAAPSGLAGPRAERVLTVAAVVVLAVPFALVLGRLLAGSSQVTLPDDLALIDLHTRQALHFHQQLGPFDRFGWNHPGPAEFYALALFYAVVGSGAKAAFVGATVINAVAALATVWVVRRRAGALASLWSALCVGLLVFVLSLTGPLSVTYSEGPLGALVSPWNPTVVVVPLVLLFVLCAAAAGGSWPSLAGALLTATFVVQTDISTLPLAGALVVLAVAGASLGAWRRRRSGERERGSAALLLTVGGLAVTVLAWVPPVVQQLSGHPGNLTLLWRFFTASHPGPGLSAAVWSVVAANSVLLLGPSAVMAKVLGHPPPAGALALALTVVVLAASVALSFWRRQRFSLTLAALAVAGTVVSLVAVTDVVGLVFGYLVLWEVAVPVAGLIAVGCGVLAPVPRRAHHHGAAHQALPAVVLGALSVVLCVALCVAMAAVPPLSSVSDPKVGALTRLVVPKVPEGRAVFVGDNGLTLLGTEQFIGLVNELQLHRRSPKVNTFWLAQFGQGYLASGHEPYQVNLWPAAKVAASAPGYLGRVGDIAVLVSSSRPR